MDRENEGTVEDGGGSQEGNANHDNGATVEVDKGAAGEDSSDNGGSGTVANGTADGEESSTLGDNSSSGREGRPKRPPRVGSVRQGRKLKRKAAWEAKKAWLKENKRLAREKRCVSVSCWCTAVRSQQADRTNMCLMAF